MFVCFYFAHNFFLGKFMKRQISFTFIVDAAYSLCLSAVKRYHDQGHFWKKEFIEACCFRGLESMTIIVGSAAVSRRQQEQTGNGMGF